MVPNVVLSISITCSPKYERPEAAAAVSPASLRQLVPPCRYRGTLARMARHEIALYHCSPTRDLVKLGLWAFHDNLTLAKIDRTRVGIHREPIALRDQRFAKCSAAFA